MTKSGKPGKAVETKGRYQFCKAKFGEWYVPRPRARKKGYGHKSRLGDSDSCFPSEVPSIQTRVECLLRLKVAVMGAGGVTMRTGQRPNHLRLFKAKGNP